MSDTMLLSSVVENTREEGGVVFTRLSVGGNPHAAAIVNAVNMHYNRLVGRDRPTEDSLREMIGEKVTLIRGGENFIGAGMIKALEGRLLDYEGKLAVIPKGKRTRGYLVQMGSLLDALPGWVTGEADRLVADARSHFPELKPLTRERLLELPPSPDDTCTVALFGTRQFPGETAGTDCVYLLGTYDPDSDIVDYCVLLIRPEAGVSEEGSAYGRDLLHQTWGEIVGFTPISYKHATDLCDLDFDDAYQQALCPVAVKP